MKYIYKQANFISLMSAPRYWSKGAKQYYSPPLPSEIFNPLSHNKTLTLQKKEITDRFTNIFNYLEGRFYSSTQTTKKNAVRTQSPHLHLIIRYRCFSPAFCNYVGQLKTLYPNGIITISKSAEYIPIN